MRTAALLLTTLALSPIAKPSASAREEAPIAIEFQLAEAKDQPPLASGSLIVPPHETTSFEVEEPHGARHVQLRFNASPRKDGTVIISMGVEEFEAQGRTVKWFPVVMGQRGMPITASTTVGNVSRTLIITTR